MTCSFRELLSPYLDGELDQLTAGKVKDHLEACSPCREELHLMAEFRHALRRAAASTEAPRFLKEKAIGKIQERQRKVSFFPLNLAYGAVLGALVLLALILIYPYWNWSRGSFTTLSGDLVRYHAAYEEGKRTLRVRSSDLQNPESWVESQMGFKALIPNAAFAEYNLVGVDVFEHGGRKFAYLKYQHNEKTIGYVIFRDPRFSLDLPEIVKVGDIELHIGKKGEFNCAAWKMGGLVYIILTTEDRSELLEYAHRCIELF